MADDNDNNRRGTDRLERVERATLRQLDDGNGIEIEVEAVHCATVNFSSKGFCIHSPSRVDEGCRVELCARMVGAPLKYYLKGCVVRCNEVDDGFLLGIELEERPGADMLGWQALFEE